MGPPRSTIDRFSFRIHAALLVVGLSSYLIFPDDVVWRSIKAAPKAPLLEHLFFATAAAALGVALLLRMKTHADASAESIRNPAPTNAVASLLQSIGIGSLLPLPGFLLLILGDLAITVFLSMGTNPANDPSAGPGSRQRSHAFRWRDALVAHLGLCCAFISMVVFSIVLIDRVGDVLFALTALISIVASSRSAPGSET